MSGIVGIYHRDGAPVDPDVLNRMTGSMRRRGPDAQRIWHDGPLGLGHAALFTTPEAERENQPATLDGQVWITADARIDEWDELRRKLEAKGRAVPATVTDVELILHAYHVWGEDCVHHLIGDFAFAIWDGRERKLFCARDRFGVRTLVYYDRGPLFVIGSDMSVVLQCAGVKAILYEPRIGDYLMGLDWLDKTTTTFENVYRLAAGHTLVVRDRVARIQQYWRYEVQPEIRFQKDEDYVEAFLERFSAAVRARLRAPKPSQVGSMLSGGLDSSSIVAVARDEYRRHGLSPFRTVSALAYKTHDDAQESYYIEAVITQGGVDPIRVYPEDLSHFKPELMSALRETIDIFDHWNQVPRIAYLAAHRQGIRVLLTGVGGNEFADLPPDYPYFFLRDGYPGRAIAALRGLHLFYDHRQTRLVPSILRYLRWTVKRLLDNKRIIEPLLRIRRQHLLNRRYQRMLSDSIINVEFAAEIQLRQRWDKVFDVSDSGHLLNLRTRQVTSFNAPLLDVGLETYDHVASQAGVETRHPYVDQRLVEFLLALPPEQIVRDHWPKGLVRVAMRDLLTDEVRFRRGIQHLGWTFLQARWRLEEIRFQEMMDLEIDAVARYIDVSKLTRVYDRFSQRVDDEAAELWYALTLVVWLQEVDYLL